MGGIQKSLLNLVKELQNSTPHEIEIFTFSKGELLEEFPKDIKIKYGGRLLESISTPFQIVKKGGVVSISIRLLLMFVVRIIGSQNLYKILFKLQKNDDTYDLAISFFNDVQIGYFNKGTNLYVNKFVKTKKKYAWLHTDPIEAGFSSSTCEKVYREFDKIICVSNAVKDKFDSLLPDYSSKTKVIYNLFPKEEIIEKGKAFTGFEKEVINIISVGRMDNSTKNFDKIPYICDFLKKNGVVNFKWRVVGSGPDFDFNYSLVDKLQVSNLVEYVGHKANPYPLIKNSDLYVLTSHYEGFPMVVNESLILGVPVLTTNYAAVNEQIQNLKNGIIASNGIEELQEIILHLLTKPSLIDEMKHYILNNSYSNKVAIKQLKTEF